MSRVVGYIVYDHRVGAPLGLHVTQWDDRRRYVLSNDRGNVTLFRSRASAERAIRAAHTYWRGLSGIGSLSDYGIYRVRGASQGKQEPQ